MGSNVLFSIAVAIVNMNLVFYVIMVKMNFLIHTVKTFIILRILDLLIILFYSNNKHDVLEHHVISLKYVQLIFVS